MEYRLKCSQCETIYLVDTKKPLTGSLGDAARNGLGMPQRGVCPRCGTNNTEQMGAFRSKIVDLGLPPKTAIKALKMLSANAPLEPGEEPLAMFFGTHVPGAPEDTFGFGLTDRRLFYWPLWFRMNEYFVTTVEEARIRELPFPAIKTGTTGGYFLRVGFLNHGETVSSKRAMTRSTFNELTRIVEALGGQVEAPAPEEPSAESAKSPVEKKATEPTAEPSTKSPHRLPPRNQSVKCENCGKTTFPRVQMSLLVLILLLFLYVIPGIIYALRCAGKPRLCSECKKPLVTPAAGPS